jgi:hypothetical protein
MTDDNPTPEELDLYQRLHDLKARRMATRDDAERNDLQIAIYETSQRIASLRWQRRQRELSD